MRSRLHSVLTLMMACLVLGAVTQSAVCELACNLGGKIECHRVAAASMQSPSADGTMAGMPTMHCSGMRSNHASKGAPKRVRIEGRDGQLCRHLSPLATVSSILRSETMETVQWVFIEPLPSQIKVAADRVAADSNAPPHGPPVNLLLIAIRV